MRPLFFLTFRSLKNGLKRSFTSPKRLIPTLVAILYYLWWFVRPLLATSSRMPSAVGGWRLPSLEFLDAVVFTGFVGLSLILMLSLFGYKSSFKPADVDVLFPTPVDPKSVLIFRIVRDYLGTLLVPIFLILVTWKPLDAQSLFRDIPHPGSAGYTLRALMLAFLLTTTAWVGIGYALSLYVNRNDRGSEARKKIIGWSISVATVAVVCYILQTAFQLHSLEEFERFAHQGWLRAFFFTATPATKMVMGPLDGSFLESLFGAFILLGISGISLQLALKQVGWMYDQAAVRGFGAESMRLMQRRGDMMGQMAELARQGKLKVRRTGWFQRLRLRGLAALLWKDALIQWRTIRLLVFFFLFVGILFIAVLYLSGERLHEKGIGYLILFMEGFVSFMVATMTSQSGFTELLRRVDFQKPLPFSPVTITISEVGAKALPAMTIPLLCSLIALILFPLSWPEVLAGVIFYPSLSALICALVCVIVLLFPEIDDVSQRGFRALVTLLGLLIAGTPGVLAFIGITILTQTPILGSVPAALFNYAVALGLTLAAGAIYRDFNPSE